ncbi:ATP-binding cassette domain-containing protein [Solwaraspora sp. WMMD937]|uniref:ATP-binding cassette domain-containing protein n=1 Tax=Solwaraspora sp. WMMD937 TaxID=3016090 RepID=UPI00249BB430|nr:ATP-binding cassette domain-containing protein [Solwaraspora sp. WMMD937]WFE20945.1 ATP-binding cassette domain-containing protein [Solwaraspora sp. WMMD937]
MDLSLRSGVTCLIGSNGSGKTTLLRILSGIDMPATGRVRVSERDLSTSEHLPGFLPQDFSAPKKATCLDFLYYVAWSRRVPSTRRRLVIENALSHTGLKDQEKRRIGALSGGMLRRLGIAQAIIHDPKFLILDEPTVGLDPGQRLAIRDHVRKLAEDGVVVYSTHIVEDVRALADRVLVLRSGKLIFDGTVSSIKESAHRPEPGEDGLEQAIGSLMGAQE